MKYNVDCPRCNFEVEVECNWDIGKCPNCSLEYYWEEHCTEDYSDCWPELYWEDFKNV